jgi:hypothetical protein
MSSMSTLGDDIKAELRDSVEVQILSQRANEPAAHGVPALVEVEAAQDASDAPDGGWYGWSAGLL